jgi:FkbM family methyltransferase
MTKPEELKKLQDRLVANTDELSHEVAARLIARRLFYMDYENVLAPLRETIWNIVSNGKRFRSIYPRDCEEQERLNILGKAYRCPYGLPYTGNGDVHMAIAFGFNQFPSAIQKRVSGKDIIDGGGCSGDSTMIFTEYDPRKVYAFEPNPDTIPGMQRVLADNAAVLKNRKARIEIVPMALGRSKGTFTLHSNGEFDAGATSLTADWGNTYEVDVISIDEFAAQHSLDVGLIKLDIEGAEYDTILGAQETIIRQKPLLLISIYHTFRDFFEIKPLIESWGLGYKFEIRHQVLNNPDGEFVLMGYVE